MSQTIEVRDLRFDLSDVPRHWHGGRKSVTSFFDNLSIFFPPGERFFITAVKAHRAQVTDPALKAEMDGFCAQEGHHSREHVGYNDMLRAQGYPVDDMEARVEAVLQRAGRRMSKRRHLAITCALEHFTSLMAAIVLRDDRPLEGAHPTLAALWRWHAAEENEHKSVAFDAYHAVGGTYLERCYIMALVTVSFWFRVLGQQFRLMRADGIAASPGEWWALFKFLFISPGGMAGLLWPYLRYYLPSFHPRDIDHSKLVDAWRAQWSGTPEYERAQRR